MSREWRGRRDAGVGAHGLNPGARLDAETVVYDVGIQRALGLLERAG